MAEQDLTILVIDENPGRAAVVEQGLAEAGYTRVSVISGTVNLLGRIQAMAPDVIIIDLENPDRDTLEQMFEVSRSIPRPIAMFVDHSDSAMIHAAIDAGVSAYVVDGLKKDRIKPIVQMAISRFGYFDRLRRERDEAREKLAERKLVDRAKGLLMTRKGITEEQAYTLLRSTAMRQNLKIADIARSVITAAEMDV